MRREGDLYRAGAAVGFSSEYIEFLRSNPLSVRSGLRLPPCHARAIVRCRTRSRRGPEYTLRESITLAGQHTALCVPLLRENEPIGTIVLARQRVEPFTQKRVELVTAFADQAGGHCNRECPPVSERKRREALWNDRLATAEVLKVIASSPSDVPSAVFEAIAASANLCLVAFQRRVPLHRRAMAHLAAFSPTNPAADEVLKSAFPMVSAEIAALEQVRNGESAQSATAGIESRTVRIGRAREFRSLLFTPLMKATCRQLVSISVTRTETGSFAGAHVNCSRPSPTGRDRDREWRLFDEVQARTRDLSEALTYQTGKRQYSERHRFLANRGRTCSQCHCRKRLRALRGQ